MPPRHPTAAHWSFPPPERPPLPGPLRRTNLRELCARPERLEHHLMVVARVGDAQLEAPTASEPLYFAHRNISDEYALVMATGDPLVDAATFRTFLSDFDSAADLARLNHRVHQLVLHPHGLLHWPGRLRAPYLPLPIPPAMRRAGYSLVFCASTPTPPGDRPLFVSAGCEAGAKRYTDAEVPLLLADLEREPSREVARIGAVTLTLQVAPSRVAPPRGGYVAILSADADGGHFPGDLIYVPEGTALSGAGIESALVMSSPAAAPAPPPRCWDAPPPAPLPADVDPLTLLAGVDGLTVADAGGDDVVVTVSGAAATVPRYWLTRTLACLALHDYRLGYIETYGGLYHDGAGFGVRPRVPW